MNPIKTTAKVVIPAVLLTSLDCRHPHNHTERYSGEPVPAMEFNVVSTLTASVAPYLDLDPSMRLVMLKGKALCVTIRHPDFT